MAKAIEQAKAETSKPTIIRLRTTIGYGSRDQGTHGVHGNPLKADDTVEIKKKFGFNPEEFFVVPDEAKKVYGDIAKKGAETADKWNKLFAEYESKYPEEAKDIKRRQEGKLPEGWEKALPTFTPTDDAVASRKLSEVLLAKLSTVIPELVSGSADLTPSNLVSLLSFDRFKAHKLRILREYNRLDGRTLSTSNPRRTVSVTTLDDTS